MVRALGTLKPDGGFVALLEMVVARTSSVIGALRLAWSGPKAAPKVGKAGALGRHTPETGIVHLVGAGPGDPELLTVRALRLLQQADVVVYDRLIGPEILAHARTDAARFYVGKERGNHSRTQAEINALLAHHARAGRCVVRLKGGDPFVFGRGGEELDYLRARGVAVEVVPGITAATGCAAAVGIPLTHRDYALGVTFVTGHAKDGAPDLDWAALAKSRQTLVIYMGVASAGMIAGELTAHGMAPTTPVAVIENGTRPQQRLVTGSIARLGDLVTDEGIAGPAVIVIGDVVKGAQSAFDRAEQLDAAEAA